MNLNASHAPALIADRIGVWPHRRIGPVGGVERQDRAPGECAEDQRRDQAAFAEGLCASIIDLG
jgi:hypothetical protein